MKPNIKIKIDSIGFYIYDVYSDKPICLDNRYHTIKPEWLIAYGENIDNFNFKLFYGFYLVNNQTK